MNIAGFTEGDKVVVCKPTQGGWSDTDTKVIESLLGKTGEITEFAQLRVYVEFDPSDWGGGRHQGFGEWLTVYDIQKVDG